jgi:hypothetical protein
VNSGGIGTNSGVGGIARVLLLFCFVFETTKNSFTQALMHPPLSSSYELVANALAAGALGDSTLDRDIDGER